MLLAAFATGVPVAGQAGFGLDAAVRSKHVWRGQTYRNGWVVQPSAFLFYRGPRAVLTGGVWMHVEPSAVEDGEDVGYGRTWGGEVNAWADVGARLGPAAVHAGWAGYFPKSDDAIGPAARRARTHELYARLRLHRPRLTPHAAIWYDVDAARGAFVEAGLQYRAPGWTQVLVPVGSLVLDATVGFSLGQEVNEADPAEVAYFRDRGLTHVDLSAATTIGYFTLGPASSAITLAFRVQINADPHLEEVSRFVDAGRRAKLWGGLTWSILGPRCRPERGLCREGTGL